MLFMLLYLSFTLHCHKYLQPKNLVVKKKDFLQVWAKVAKLFLKRKQEPIKHKSWPIQANSELNKPASRARMGRL